jgi:adenylate kinase
MAKGADYQGLPDGFGEPLKAILMFGPPGSGKGTQGKLLRDAGGHFHLSSGDIFRGIDPHSPAGQLFHKYASKGQLVPDLETVQIWHHHVQELIATRRYFPHQQLLLLDGIPRTMAQAEMLDKYLNVLAIIVLETKNVEGLIGRMKARALKENRMDDTDENVLKKRMEVYHNETLKVLEHYPPKIVHHFNADQRRTEVLRDVLAQLSHLL